MKLLTLEDLKKVSFKISVLTAVIFDPVSRSRVKYLEKKPNIKNQTYSVDNNQIKFACDDMVYIMPYMKTAIYILRENGFSDRESILKYFSVDMLLNEKEKEDWILLEEKAKEQRINDFATLIEEEIQCSALPKDLLENCMEIPEIGLVVKGVLGEATYYPMNSNLYKGFFCIRNDVCQFIHCDGKTYVTRSCRVINALKTNGYKECFFEVMFSGGEMIEDTTYRERWENLKVV